MKQIKILNIEQYVSMFNANNKEFNDIKWVEPVFIAMTSAYHDDISFNLETNNVYLYNMLTMNYKENTSYSPVEKVITRNGLEKNIYSFNKHNDSELWRIKFYRYKRFKRLFTVSFFRTYE